MTRWIGARKCATACSLLVGMLSGGCGGKAAGPVREDDSGGAGGMAQVEPHPGWGVPRPETPGPGWSLRDDTPYSRLYASVVLDTTADRMILFGGYTNDVWSLALSGEHELMWSALSLQGEIPPAQNVLGVYEPAGNRIVAIFDELVGEQEPFYHAQVWQLSLGAAPEWRRLQPTGRAPGNELSDALVALDNTGRRMFALGGCGAWTLSFDDGDGRWSRIGDGPPGACEPPAQPFFAGAGGLLVFDAPRDRLVVFGLAEVWQLSLDSGAWSSLGATPCGGTILSTPAFDETNAQVVYVPSCREGTAIFSLVRDKWSERDHPRVESSQFDGFGQVGAFDAARSRILYPPGDSGNATWQLDTSTLELTPLTPDTRGPPVGQGSRLVWDSARNVVVAFGGEYGAVTSQRGLEPGARWTRLAEPLGSEDPGGAFYEPDSHAIIAITDRSAESQLRRLAQDDGAWEPIVVPGGPTSRSGSFSAYDSDRKQLIISGGSSPANDYPAMVNDDVWALSLDGEPSWSQLAETGDGSGRINAIGAFDPVHRRLIAYGGLDQERASRPGVAVARSDLRALSLENPSSGWVVLTAHGVAPELHDPAAVYDSEGKRIVFVDVSGPGTQVAALELGAERDETTTWHTFCSVGLLPGQANRPRLALVPDGIFVAVGDAAFRFDLTTPYCD